MLWATPAQIHFDRVAAAWLIVRFIDPEARFLFVPAGGAPPEEARIFGFSYGEFSAHDPGGTIFDKLLEASVLSDPDLGAMAGMVREVVATVLTPAIVPGSSAIAMLALAEGLMLDSADDLEMVSRTMLIYDAMLKGLQARAALAKDRPDATSLELASKLVENVAAKRSSVPSRSTD